MAVMNDLDKEIPAVYRPVGTIVEAWRFIYDNLPPLHGNYPPIPDNGSVTNIPDGLEAV